jgi:hypothetical protein
MESGPAVFHPAQVQYRFLKYHNLTHLYSWRMIILLTAGMRPEVEFLDEIQTKVFRDSSLLFTVTSTALP